MKGTAVVTVKVDASNFISSIEQLTRNMRAIGKELEQIRKERRILHRDWVRNNRRPALIHNGRKPR